MEIELTLKQQTATVVEVTCNSQSSHTFDYNTIPAESERAILNDPVAYGEALYQALFPQGSLAQQALAQMPERILLIATTDDLDAIAWEYLHGPNGFLVLETPFIRGLPAEQRIDPPQLTQPLHIIAIPSNPLSTHIAPLNIDGEWQRLKDVLGGVQSVLTLERTRPPTIERVRSLVAGQRNRVVHFMGHGKQHASAAILCFEKENGALDLVSAKQLVTRVRGTVFLVTLNACMSATPGPTKFSNLAKALIQQKIPYALGMRLSIADEDACAFSRTYYDELAHGVPIEEALLQVRLTLSSSQRGWAVGVPVLYTALKSPASGFANKEGKLSIDEHQPSMDLLALPRAQGTFQGRIEDLTQIGSCLTGDNRARILTIHGSGGQGKTALAREAVERFAYAWSGGVWAISLENLPSRTTFALELARFLSIDTQNMTDLVEIERRLFARLAEKRTLIVLDNAEALVEAVEAKHTEALALTQLLQQLPSTTVSLLVASRIQLGWVGEQIHLLGGLLDAEGAALFEQGASARRHEITHSLARQLSTKVKGHPLGLRLLSGAFNSSQITLSAFLAECEHRLPRSEDKYAPDEHRHRTLIACIETSVRYLNEDLRTLLGGLWIFRAPFLSSIAARIFDPDTSEGDETDGKERVEEEGVSPTEERLHALWQRGLLARETTTTREGTWCFYYLLPTTRPYVEKHLKRTQGQSELLEFFALTYARLVSNIHYALERGAIASIVFHRTQEDIAQASFYLKGKDQGYYLLHWGWIMYRQGNSAEGLKSLEQALEISRAQEQHLVLMVLSNLAAVCNGIGQSKRARELYEEALLITREVGNRAEEAAALSNLAEVYRGIGQWQRARELYEEALLITREVGYRAGEAAALANLAIVNDEIGQTQRARELYEEALPITREVGNRAGEATTLANLAEVYREIGQLQRARELCEEALPITREVGDRAGEAVTLSNLAAVYDAIRQWQQARELYEEALLITREIGYRAREGIVLSNLAVVYYEIGQPQRARELYEEALPITREIGNRTREATTLANLAEVYHEIGQPQRARELYEEVLPITREIGNRTREATTLANLAKVYHEIGQPQRARELFEGALPIIREVGDRAGEAATLANLAEVYREIGQPQQARELFEGALPIIREVGDRAGEAVALANLAEVYHEIGQPQQARELYEEVLPITREIGNRTREATTLANLAKVYHEIEQPQRARELYEGALPIIREVGDRAGEAATLANLAEVYREIGQPQQARELYEEALPIIREVGHHAGEATTLFGLAVVYNEIGQPQQARELYEEALPIIREVGDRAWEGTTLNNLALVYQVGIGQPQQARELYEEALLIMREVGDRAGEAATLANLAVLFRRNLHNLLKAITCLEEAIALLQQAELPQDSAGHTIESLSSYLQAMRNEVPQQIVVATIAVMTTMPERRSEWREFMMDQLQRAQQQEADRQIDIEFFTAILALLDGQLPTLLPDCPYAAAIAAIQEGIAQGGLGDEKSSEGGNPS